MQVNKWISSWSADKLHWQAINQGFSAKLFCDFLYRLVVDWFSFHTHHFPNESLSTTQSYLLLVICIHPSAIVRLITASFDNFPNLFLSSSLSAVTTHQWSSSMMIVSSNRIVQSILQICATNYRSFALWLLQFIMRWQPKRYKQVSFIGKARLTLDDCQLTSLCVFCSDSKLAAHAKYDKEKKTRMLVNPYASRATNSHENYVRCDIVNSSFLLQRRRDEDTQLHEDLAVTSLSAPHTVSVENILISKTKAKTRERSDREVLSNPDNTKKEKEKRTLSKCLVPLTGLPFCFDVHSDGGVTARFLLPRNLIFK